MTRVKNPFKGRNIQELIKTKPLNRGFFNKMAKKVEKIKVSEEDDLRAGIYKGYDIRWLRNQTDHPDHALAAEGENKREKLLKK